MSSTVLLVEDDDAYRYAVEKHLVRAGFAVVAVSTTMEALNALDGDSQPNVIVLADIRMPAGQPHGAALANMLFQRNPRMRILLMTGYPDVAKAVIEQGVHRVIMKPADLVVLVDEVKALSAA
jgi:DNA-binding NtrC family response regulator